MRYAIGSVSKQFTATAILLLQEDGKLSLDDKVAKWFPQLTRAGDISIRQLLSMTSGYQDYWPQDYVFMDMQRPAPAREIMQRWAGKELDFEPGSQWQYSNTNYVIAAAIVERVSGMRFMEFLTQRIFPPLKMTSVGDFDTGPLGANDAEAAVAECARSVPAGAERGGRVAVWRRTARDDRPRSGALEHRGDEPVAPEARVVQVAADRHAPRGGQRDRITALASTSPRSAGGGGSVTAAPCPVTRRPARSFLTIGRRSSCSPTSTRARRARPA